MVFLSYSAAICLRLAKTVELTQEIPQINIIKTTSYTITGLVFPALLNHANTTQQPD